MSTIRPRGVILDVDGTLVDSNDAHAQAWIDAFRDFGYDGPTFAAVRAAIGKGGDKMLAELIRLDDSTPEGERLKKHRSGLFKKRYLPSLRPTPGARELLARMKRDGLRLVVASSAQADELEPLLLAADAADLVDEETSSDDAERSKPDPDIVLAALRRSSLRPREAVMLGDTPYDVESSRRSGVRIIALRCGGWDDDALAGAAAIYDHPADLLAHYDESPLVVAG